MNIVYFHINNNKNNIINTYTHTAYEQAVNGMIAPIPIHPIIYGNNVLDLHPLFKKSNHGVISTMRPGCTALVPLKSHHSPATKAVTYPGILFGGVQQIQFEDRENGDLGTVAPYPLIKGSGGSCNLVQEISFHIVKVS